MAQERGSIARAAEAYLPRLVDGLISDLLADLPGLLWLRDQLGDAFAGGVVLHTGRHIYQLEDRIVAAPICTIWA